jgi:hypothetical protein
MNKMIRFGFLATGVALVLAAGSLRAQTSLQSFTFSIVAEYQTNVPITNLTTGATNVRPKIHTILISTIDVVKALAIELDRATNASGTNTNTWNGSTLLREVNLTNGHEGIFLRKAGKQANVSAYFPNFTNNFTAAIPSFPEWTNFQSSTNGIGVTNVSYADLEPIWDRVHPNVNDIMVTNVQTAGLYYFSLNTVNLQLNLLGMGDGLIVEVSGSTNHVHYTGQIDTETAGTAGSVHLNLTTNIFDVGISQEKSETNQIPYYVAGPARGSVVLGQPWYLPIPGPE